MGSGGGRLDYTLPDLPKLYDSAGQRLGIVGLGRIGKAVVPRARGLGLKLLANDPFPDEAFAAAHEVRFCPLDELLASADYVSLHLPLAPETAHVINAESLAQMKAGAVLINTSRGGLVDEGALIDALKRGHLSAAGLDVFEEEPLPASSPLTEMENVLLSPHVAGIDHDSLDAMALMSAECVVALHQGRWPEECVVNRELAGRWTW